MSGPKGLAEEGERFGPYRIMRRIAAGGMAEIFIARQQTLEGLERKVVLKRILPELNDDEEFITMFLDEARLLASISHPNIAQAFDLGQLGDVFYLVMEYVRGPTLNDLLRVGEKERAGGIPLRQSLGITLALAEALAYIHECVDGHGRPLQIVHRDLNPANVIISYDGAVKLIDFGIAKAATKVHQTRTEVVKGTYGYIAPEALVRAGPVDHRADVYGLGVLLYEMLVGVHPFDSGNMLQVVEAMVRGDFIRPSERMPRIPAALDVLVCRCLAKRPESRVQTVRDFIDALVSIMASEGCVCTMRDLGDLVRQRVPDVDGRDPVRGLRRASVPSVQEAEGNATMRFVTVRGVQSQVDDESEPTFASEAPPTLPSVVRGPQVAVPTPALESRSPQNTSTDDSVTTRAPTLMPHALGAENEHTSGEVPAYRPSRRDVPTVALKMASSRRRFSLLPIALFVAVLGVAVLGLAWFQMSTNAKPADLKIPDLLQETQEVIEVPGIEQLSAEEDAKQTERLSGEAQSGQDVQDKPAPEERAADDSEGDSLAQVVRDAADNSREPSADAKNEAPDEATGDGDAASTVSGDERRVELFSNPRGAIIYEDDVRLGKAPIVVESTDDERKLEARLSGYPTVERTLEPGMKDLRFDLAAERSRRLKLRRIRRARAAKRP